MAAGGPDQFRRGRRGVAAVLLRLDPEAGTPLYEQIFRGMRERILGRELAPGVRLPSSRQLARDLGVSRTTVLQALEGLEAEGYVVTRAASSTRVAPELPELEGRRAEATRVGREQRLSRVARSLRSLPAGTARVGAAPRAFRPG